VKLQIKTTFDFGKLAKKMPKILEKHMQRTGRSSAQGAKEAISKGLSPPLKKSTIARRKYKVKVATGGYSQGGGTKPLFHTGTLFRDIKGTSEGLEMWDYGLHQHKGHKAGHFPPRPFIFPSEKAILKSFDAFRKDIRKGLKK
tara:strand:+ start:592 stop:1020 length:429 start_codon:yes stop_codon:yes gene_type:complete